ncbi:carboxypeptidase family protein [Luteimonas cucumeris]|uniref:Carboxypeptidase family protein n=1 Tax=Luteimonas cucumeris TaxID=985012 RepID=A0A562KXY9_9GAMM|nr:TonB-dependent receptor [Luteimonas cucumeris]TWI00217.1 carboxypeptidase family protein [Luteimonas cucumeris]
MAHNNRVRLSRLSLGLIVALAAAPVFAQSTTAGVGGQVLGADGQPVAGAVVTITHTESGTVSRAATDASGRYNARGLRVGGPYTITVTKTGAGTSSQENVYLALDAVSQVNARLSNDVATLESVQVVATAGSDVFDSNRMGAGTNINNALLNSLPSIKRDLQDYARLDPRVSQTDKERGEISALGQNSRYNSITVDSVSISDTFGLESNNLPTVRQPISMDAIEEVQVNVANYDVTQKGYTGANINAVTKSGTNEFHGSVYGTYRNSDWVREEDDRGFTFNRFDDEKTYGATFGGPIVKDKLFFFLNYDKTAISAPAPDLSNGPIGRGTITQQNVEDVRQEAIRRGMDPGTLGTSATDTELENFLARFDWNINDDHRAALRLSHTEQAEAILPGFGTGFFSLSSYWYSQKKEFDNYVVELYSDWNDSFSTEFRASYRDYTSAPDIYARQPQVQVDFGRDNMRFGTEAFRQINQLDTKTWNTYGAGNLFLGDHTVKFGFDYESNDITNLFLESGFGQYRFGSLDLFEQGVYREYVARVSPTGNAADATASMKMDNLGLFVQDTWIVTDQLTLTAGLRWDKTGIDDVPTFNEAALAEFGYDNRMTADGATLIQPRFGFNYTLDTERRTQLRGGIGLFQGAAANVWMINPFTNNGETIAIYGCGFSGSIERCPSTVIPGREFSSDPDNQPQFGSARADVDLLAPDFEQPSVWKANFAIDHELPWWGTVLSSEVVFTSVHKGITYEHLNLGDPTAVGPDGRQLFWDSTDASNYNGDEFDATSRANANQDFREVMLARNTDKGDGVNFSVTLTKPKTSDNPWFWQLAYAYNDATEVNGLTSSRAISNWRARAVFNPNEDVASRSAYAMRDRFTAAVAWDHVFFGNNKTTVSMFYEGRRGKPYSWTFAEDMNGDGLPGNDLLYIPGGRNDVVFLDPSEEATFWELVDHYNLGGGGPTKRNSAFSPWTHSFDLRISQELPGFFEGNKAEIWLDVLNVGNLLNKDWGHLDEVGFQSDGGQVRSFVNFAGISEDGKYIYDLVDVENFARRDNAGESRWALQLGFRYKF